MRRTNTNEKVYEITEGQLTELVKHINFKLDEGYDAGTVKGTNEFNIENRKEAFRIGYTDTDGKTKWIMCASEQDLDTTIKNLEQRGINNYISAKNFGTYWKTYKVGSDIKI